MLDHILHHLVHPSSGTIFLGTAWAFTSLSSMLSPNSVSDLVSFRFGSNPMWTELYNSLTEKMYVIKNRHCSTILAIMRPKPVLSWSFRTRIFSWRECLVTPDDGNLVLDYFQWRGTPSGIWSFWTSLFFTPGSGMGILRSHKNEKNRPVVLVVHGLMGHSEESYVQQTCCEICHNDPRHPLVVAMNYRGAFNHKLTGEGGYSFYDVKDFGFVIAWLRERHEGPLFVVGFSMGAAKLANYLGRTEEASNITAGCCICCPWDFTSRNTAVHNPSWMEKLYHLVLTGALKTWVLVHFFELRTNKSLIDSAPIFRYNAWALYWWLFEYNVKSFDANFTIHWLGYRSVDEYYEAASPSKHLSKVKTPLLIINSKNDPLIPHYVNPTEEDVQENPNLFVIESKYGGHIGFWTPFNGCYATQCFIKFSMLDNFKKQRARGTPEMRRRDSLEVSKRLSNSSNTNLSDYTIIRRVGESEESDGENVAYVGSSADEDEDEEEDEGQGGDDKKIEVPESPKHEDITANFVKGFA